MTVVHSFEHAATDADIANILEDLFEDVYEDIEEIGATCQEVLQAKACVEDFGHVGLKPEENLSRRALRVYEVLQDEFERRNSYEAG